VLSRWAGFVLGYATVASLAAHAAAHESDLRLGAGFQGGVTVNSDQWTAGGYGRLEGVCVFVCPRDLGIGLHALGGIGGNHVTVRVGPRLDYLLWLADEGTVGLDLGVGASVIGFIPVGNFAEFCHRVDLDGCGGTYFGAEGALGLRLWPVFVEGVLASGELPVLTVTAGIHWTLWAENP
jgi:hypothetical protein